MDVNAEIVRIQSFVDNGNYHAAMNIALSALNECRRNDNQADVDTFLDVINDIAQTLSEAFGSEG